MLDLSVRSFPVSSPRRISSTGRIRSTLTGHRPASGAIPLVLCRPVSLTGRTLPASGASRPSVRSVDRRQHLHDQLVFTSNFFTLDPMCQPQEFASDAIENRHVCYVCKCANTTKCTPPCVCVFSIFTIISQRMLATQLATPLDPSDNAKLDHLSGTR